jgi:hypothetical protein
VFILRNLAAAIGGSLGGGVAAARQPLADVSLASLHISDDVSKAVAWRHRRRRAAAPPGRHQRLQAAARGALRSQLALQARDLGAQVALGGVQLLHLQPQPQGPASW